MSQRPILDSVYGYYQVGNQLYVNKTEATYQASVTNQDVHWNFFNELWSTLDWTQRPAESLDELYRQRAQQIRDKYDHVIVYFSGGMDSWQVLNSFLANGIHVDEVVSRWLRAERQYTGPSLDTHQANMGSECEYAVMPVLEHVKKHYPQTNVVLDDFSDSIQGELTEKDFVLSNNWQHMPSFYKLSRKTDRERELANTNKKIAIVIGCDKIRTSVKDGNFYATFRDQFVGGDNDPDRCVEFFYWTPDFPKLVVAQAHMIKDYMQIQYQLNPAYRPNYNTYHEMYQEVCYPGYNIDTFQARKPLGSLVWLCDRWIYNYNPTYYHSWKHTVDQYYKTIDDRFLERKTRNNRNFTVGIRRIDSPDYLVATNTGLPDFKM